MEIYYSLRRILQPSLLPVHPRCTRAIPCFLASSSPFLRSIFAFYCVTASLQPWYSSLFSALRFVSVSGIVSVPPMKPEQTVSLRLQGDINKQTAPASTATGGGLNDARSTDTTKERSGLLVSRNVILDRDLRGIAA